MMSRPVYMPPTQGGAIAQLGERLNGIQEVVGSIPIGSTRDFTQYSTGLAIRGDERLTAMSDGSAARA